ncbi:MAG: hypothetical protein C0617_06530 [Desulfuromonas sp.]|uniref:TraR/DksA family transcriptional regulator n=1 Tax=Desulfuromonas sp. TaxID=892 RepID=UPI000CA8EA85|nr:TraR/DksA C4-type zinc finger protein [Desulfuromonas sp.]PLX84860.1 MAG: hypothetical protein C0617_06530 [Desulfuromonas sp.]
MSEELSAGQVEELHRKLFALRKEIQGLLAATEEGARPVDLGQPIGRLSRMDAMQQQSMAQANRQGHELRLRQVKAALAAIDRDEYGTCRRCEEAIGYRRLSARPETPFCLDCQGQAESRR